MRLIYQTNSETYFGSCQISMMELFLTKLLTAKPLSKIFLNINVVSLLLVLNNLCTLVTTAIIHISTLQFFKVHILILETRIYNLQGFQDMENWSPATSLSEELSCVLLCLACLLSLSSFLSLCVCGSYVTFVVYVPLYLAYFICLCVLHFLHSYHCTKNEVFH